MLGEPSAPLVDGPGKECLHGFAMHATVDIVAPAAGGCKRERYRGRGWAAGDAWFT